MEGAQLLTRLAMYIAQNNRINTDANTRSRIEILCARTLRLSPICNTCHVTEGLYMEFG
jgi:hypothetical protein